MRGKFIIFCIALITISACSNPDPKLKTDCDNFASALLDKDEEALSEVFDDLLKNTDPNPSDEDPLGHEQNFEKVVDEINASCDNISAFMLCYACIKTLPVQTELILEINDQDSTIKRVVDIITPENKELRYYRVHD